MDELEEFVRFLHLSIQLFIFYYVDIQAYKKKYNMRSHVYKIRSAIARKIVHEIVFYLVGIKKILDYIFFFNLLLMKHICFEKYF